MVITCLAERFVYRHPDSDWCVLIACDESGAEMRLVGNLADVQIGGHLEATGEWESDKRYGKSFKVKSYQTTRPRSLEGMKAYLVSQMHGVGPSMADKIVAQFGDETLSIIDNDPNRLLEVPGFGPSKLGPALEEWQEKNATRDVKIKLQEYGATPNLAQRIYRAWGERTLDTLEENPYQLTEIDRIGFTIANNIAMGMGIAINDPRRIDAGIEHVLDQAAKKDGHVFLKLAEVLEQARTVLKIDERPELIADRVKRLAQAGVIVLEPSAYGDRHVYLPTYWKKEVRLASKFRSLAEQAPIFTAPTDQPYEEDIQITDRQWQAIQTTLSYRASVLTGGPGTGKCVVGDTRVYVNDDLEAIAEVWSRCCTDEEFDGEGYWTTPSEALYVPSLDQHGNIVARRVSRLYRQRVAETGRRIKTTDGSEIVMTQAHRLHGNDDWVREITIGDTACLPARLPHGSQRVDPRLARLLAWQIAEGCEYPGFVTMTQSIRERGRLISLRQDAQHVANLLDLKINNMPICPDRSGITEKLVISSAQWISWLEKQGYVWGHRSADKRIPRLMMKADANTARTFLREIFAAEGSVEIPRRTLEITSASKELIEQLAMLLRRFGIWMRYRKTVEAATNGTGIKRPYWTGYIQGSSLRTYYAQIGIADERKQAALRDVCKATVNINVETIPSASILSLPKQRSELPRHFFGVTTGCFSTQHLGPAAASVASARMRDMCDGATESTYRSKIGPLPGRGSHRYKIHDFPCFERMPVGQIATLTDQLERRATREVFYGVVSAVEDVVLNGWVYDFEVEDTHNYVAGGFLSHNTTSCRILCDTIDRMGLKIQLCAPTGKAAKRISEATGHEAATIHRLLEWQPFGGFARNAQNPLAADVVVVDEASMLDLPLADSFFQAIGDKTHVVLVGDTDQLPPVGTGRVLDDIMRSKRVPITVLDKVFRQARRSMIIQAAYAINSGRMPDDDPVVAQEKLGPEDEVIHDYYWIPRTDNEEIGRLTVDFATERIPARYGLDPRTDIQVIAPQKNTAVGVDALNLALQARINIDGLPISEKKGFRIGDKLLNTQNNYTHDVMNGEFAVIAGYNAAEKLVELELDERVVEMGLDDVESSFLLAYATTVHKMQGSSAKAVVLPMSMSYSRMLSRHLVYTAVTRAEQLCIMIGTGQALGYAVGEASSRPRNSALAERLVHPSMSGQLI